MMASAARTWRSLTVGTCGSPPDRPGDHRIPHASAIQSHAPARYAQISPDGRRFVHLVRERNRPETGAVARALAAAISREIDRIPPPSATDTFGDGLLRIGAEGQDRPN